MVDYSLKRRSDCIVYAHWENCIRQVFRDHGQDLPVSIGFSIDPDPLKHWLIEAYHDNWSANDVWWEWVISR